jgi:amino-acid N-acetyltransferase
MIIVNYTLSIIKDQKSLEKLRQFLRLNKLPASDLNLEGNHFVGYQDEVGELIGSGGLELYGDVGLLRSLAVDEKMRGKSVGSKLVDEIIDKANNSNIKDLYLLTETAHDYFLKKGFQDVPREKVPDIIKQTTEFVQVCPASAIVMKLTRKQ